MVAWGRGFLLEEGGRRAAQDPARTLGIKALCSKLSRLSASPEADLLDLCVAVPGLQRQLVWLEWGER